ncbi:MAG: hypothetical protein ACLSE6_03100 [Alphaproteobacteria bacterium]
MAAGAVSPVSSSAEGAARRLKSRISSSEISGSLSAGLLRQVRPALHQQSLTGKVEHIIFGRPTPGLIHPAEQSLGGKFVILVSGI